MKKIAIIGGSGLSQFEGLQGAKATTQSTQYGEALLIEAELDGHPVIFMPRHGAGHTIPPHKINYRANIAALRDCGVTTIVAVNAVGGIHEKMGPAVLAVPHQIVDYSYGREHTFLDGADGVVDHIDFTFPYAETVRQRLLDSAAELELPIVDFGVYGCTQGPRLETAAEIQRLKRDGCDVVGMTGMPEAALAREVSIDYASLCLVVNWGAGLSDELVLMKDIQRILTEEMLHIRAIIRRVVAMIAADEAVS